VRGSEHARAPAGNSTAGARSCGAAGTRTDAWAPDETCATAGSRPVRGRWHPAVNVPRRAEGAGGPAPPRSGTHDSPGRPRRTPAARAPWPTGPRQLSSPGAYAQARAHREGSSDGQRSEPDAGRLPGCPSRGVRALRVRRPDPRRGLLVYANAVSRRAAPGLGPGPRALFLRDAWASRRRREGRARLGPRGSARRSLRNGSLLRRSRATLHGRGDPGGGRTGKPPAAAADNSRRADDARVPRLRVHALWNVAAGFEVQGSVEPGVASRGAGGAPDTAAVPDLPRVPRAAALSGRVPRRDLGAGRLAAARVQPPAREPAGGAGATQRGRRQCAGRDLVARRARDAAAGPRRRPPWASRPTLEKPSDEPAGESRITCT